MGRKLMHCTHYQGYLPSEDHDLKIWKNPKSPAEMANFRFRPSIWVFLISLHGTFSSRGKFRSIGSKFSTAWKGASRSNFFPRTAPCSIAALDAMRDTIRMRVEGAFKRRSGAAEGCGQCANHMASKSWAWSFGIQSDSTPKLATNIHKFFNIQVAKWIATKNMTLTLTMLWQL